MIHYGVSSFSPSPKWQDYEVQNYYERHKRATPEEQIKLEEEKNRLHQQREIAEKKFQQNLFFVSVPIGIISVIFGAFLAIQAIGTGLMFGGIFSVCDGYLNYWDRLADPLKFISMLLLFIVLIIVGYKKLEKTKGVV